MLALVHLADLDPRRGSPLRSPDVFFSIFFRFWHFCTSVSASDFKTTNGGSTTKQTTGDDFFRDDVFFEGQIFFGGRRIFFGGRNVLRERETVGWGATSLGDIYSLREKRGIFLEGKFFEGKSIFHRPTSILYIPCATKQNELPKYHQRE